MQPKIHYPDHKTPSLDTTLGQNNPVHILARCFYIAAIHYPPIYAYVYQLISSILVSRPKCMFKNITIMQTILASKEKV
jgi:hypothetical protein